MLSIIDLHSFTTRWKKLWNEDALFTMTLDSTPGSPVALCCAIDGISSSNGNISSEIAVNTLYRSVGERLLPLLPSTSVADNQKAAAERIPNELRGVIQDIHRALCDDAASNCRDLGCTVSLALVMSDTVFTANVGDSPVFLATASGLRELYRPQHSGGDLSQLAKWCGPPRDTLKSDNDIPVRIVPLEEDGILLVGTDGALGQGAIEEKQLQMLTQTALEQWWPMEQLTRALCQVVEQGQSRDNLSVIALNYSFL